MTHKIPQAFYRATSSIILLVCLLLPSTLAMGWGERGHHTICFVATRLVKNSALKSFLKPRGDLLGHVCNLPDVSWRDMGPIAASGDHTHFLNPQNLGLTTPELPTDLFDLYSRFQGVASDKLGHPINVENDLGTLWWRADQFRRLAIIEAKKAAESQKAARPFGPPLLRFTTASTVGEQMDEMTRSIFSMMVNFGLAGHFVGDASQPLHNHSDYDGWDAGHGGLHSYYESSVVNEMDLTLDAQVLAAAAQLNFQKGATTSLEKMRILSSMATGDYDEMMSRDELEAPSQVLPPKPGESGQGARVKAKRPHPAERVAAFSPLIIKEMAASAALLAAFWDETMDEGGAVPLNLYRSYLYPMNTDFVGPDYIPSK